MIFLLAASSYVSASSSSNSSFNSLGLLYILGIMDSDVAVLVVTKSRFVNVNGGFVEHANEGIQPLAAPQKRKHSNPPQMNKHPRSPQTLPERKIEIYLSGISSNTSRVSSPLATGAAVAATLSAASEPFFPRALFTAGGFAAIFLGRCLGIGGVFAIGRTDGVDGALAIGPTAAACGGATT
jgi:hypothetical protein